ncbi:hypothetical protein HKX48_006656 [Thoreauomyces humboldtii]|nr:hypothetical protein HKX48_006656 [Thoreauomyces humboldtii]
MGSVPHQQSPSQGNTLTSVTSRPTGAGALHLPPLAPSNTNLARKLSFDNNDHATLEMVANFRDIGRNHNDDAPRILNDTTTVAKLKHGNFFRSARLDNATASDVNVLKSIHGIRTVIDLRSELERKDCAHVSATFLSLAIEQEVASEMNPVRSRADSAEAEKEYFSHKAADDAGSIGSATPGGAQRCRYSIEFAGHEFRRNGVWKPLGVWQKCKVVAYMASKQKPKAVQMIGEEVICPKGLQGLYHDFADFCGREIVRALKLLAAPQNFPVLVHCTQGKDRTGLVVALALHCAGVPLPLILEDFERSQAGLDSQREIMVNEMRKTGLDPSFSDAPRDVLADTFRYIVEKHGSVESYLDGRDFGKDWRQRLRNNLVEN